MKQANPIIEAKQDFSERKIKFIGVYGISLSIPGIPGGISNSIVELHGVEPIDGTTDFSLYIRQNELQKTAIVYATTYNKRLLQLILANPDSKSLLLLQEVDKELQEMENSDPITDSKKSFESGSAEFILISGETAPLIPDYESNAPLLDYRMRYLKSSFSLLGSQDQVRLNNLIKYYIIPYNNNLVFMGKRRAVRD